MRYKTIIILCTLMSLLCFSCAPQLCLQKRTDRLVEKSQKKTDIVYLYSVAFNDFNLVWYHKDNYIYGFLVKPYNTTQYQPIEAKDIVISSDILTKYFDNSLSKNILYFEHKLDGAWIKLYINNKEPLFSSIDIECLFNSKFEVNSFPYKLQYDFSKLRHIPIDFDFEKMYSE